MQTFHTYSKTVFSFRIKSFRSLKPKILQERHEKKEYQYSIIQGKQCND